MFYMTNRFGTGLCDAHSAFISGIAEKNTPPAKCSTKKVHPIEVKEKAVHRLERKGLTTEDWAEIRKMEVQNYVPNWFVLFTLLFVVELIYLAASRTS